MCVCVLSSHCPRNVFCLYPMKVIGEAGLTEWLMYFHRIILRFYTDAHSNGNALTDTAAQRHYRHHQPPLFSAAFSLSGAFEMHL